MYDLELIQIEIWLVEAVEQYQTICASLNETFHKIGDGCHKRTDFHSQWDFDRRFHFSDQFNLCILDIAGSHFHIGGDEIQIQFQGICPSFLDPAGIIGPAALRDAVQAADDRDG